MDTTNRPMPQARDEGLVVQELPDETLVYDLERHRAHALNRTAAWVWRHCDGKTSVAEMAQALHRDLGVPQEEEAVWLALQRLGRVHLLDEKPTPPTNGANSSRRALVRCLAMAGGLAVVTSIVSPEAHAAGGSTCTGAGTCRTGTCCCICKNGSNKGCRADTPTCAGVCPGGMVTSCS